MFHSPTDDKAAPSLDEHRRRRAVVQGAEGPRAGEMAFANYRPKITSIPASSNSTFDRESFPTRSVSIDLSNAMTADTFATESFGRPVARAASVMLPGASAHFRLLVNGTQTAVASRLRFNASPCTTTTGLRRPGPDPFGSGTSAHQTSPPERSPLRSSQGPACGDRDERIFLIADPIENPIHGLSDFIRRMARHVLLERFAEYVAAGAAAPPRQTLRSLEQFVWN